VISRSAVSLLVLAVAVAGSASAAGSQSPVGQSIYVARPDPRACPSPLCGGYWVARANDARTRCHDGLLRPRCYVTAAVDVDRHPLEAGIPNGALVRAEIAPRANEGFGELGELVVADVRAPVGKGVKGTYYRARDLGIRCVRAPCFHLRAARLNRSSRTIVSSLDLASIVRPSARERVRAEAALSISPGLWLLGSVIETSQGGRILLASRFYLGSER
jgi:Domain of unknown function (DUF6748)